MAEELLEQTAEEYDESDDRIITTTDDVLANMAITSMNLIDLPKGTKERAIEAEIHEKQHKLWIEEERLKLEKKKNLLERKQKLLQMELDILKAEQEKHVAWANVGVSLLKFVGALWLGIAQLMFNLKFGNLVGNDMKGWVSRLFGRD